MNYLSGKCRAAAVFGLALAVSCAGTSAAWASPEFAHSSEKWASLRDNVLEYGELADLIHEYNATVINNRMEYDEYRGKDHDDMKNAYQDIADKMAASSDRILDSVNEEQPGYGSAAASAISARLSAEQNQEMADQQNEDGRVKKLEYDRQEAVLVQEAQTKMLSYWQREKQDPALREAESLARSQYNAVAVKAAQGMATQADLLSAKEKAEAALAAIETNNKERDGLRRELCVMTGWNYDAQPDIREIPAPGQEEADNINLEADKEAALVNNYTQAANERRLSFTGNGSQWELMNHKVENGSLQIEADVEAKYKLLKQAQADFVQAEGELEVAVQNARSAERRYSLGTISRNEMTETQGGLASKQSTRDVAGLKYRQALEDYRWAVNGLARTEG